MTLNVNHYYPNKTFLQSKTVFWLEISRMKNDNVKEQINQLIVYCFSVSKTFQTF